MNIIFFVHPSFLESLSMPKFAAMLSDGMKKKGHHVEIWSPQPFFFRLPVKNSWRKWLGYLDQYILFPRQVKRKLNYYKNDTIFVFADQALGPWVPLVADYPHVIHCHDFLSQQSALGEIPENKTGWTGKQYQRFIRNGFSKGKNFISVSHNTKAGLHRFLTSAYLRSEVVYNGLNQSFNSDEPDEARLLLGGQIGTDFSAGYILHVGGNQWYKNRKGVIEIYDAWRKTFKSTLPLLMVGRKPGGDLLDTCKSLTSKSDIHWLCGMSDEQVKTAYKGAVVFLYPSLAEGFGWPIAEAMISGCPVITTNEAPMTEVAGDAGFLIDRRPTDAEKAKDWAIDAAKILNKVVMLSKAERKVAVDAGIQNAGRFNTENALNNIEVIYKEILLSGRKDK